jgi:predicted SprT family Zn-dependent metalloprotease
VVDTRSNDKMNAKQLKRALTEINASYPSDASETALGELLKEAHTTNAAAGAKSTETTGAAGKAEKQKSDVEKTDEQANAAGLNGGKTEDTSVNNTPAGSGTGDDNLDDEYQQALAKMKEMYIGDRINKQLAEAKRKFIGLSNSSASIGDLNESLETIEKLEALLKPKKCDQEGYVIYSDPTREAKKVFSQIKEKLAQSFLAELDKKITGEEISRLAASTGGVKIIWSRRLKTTAGRAIWRREIVRPSTGGKNGEPAPTYCHYARIELAEKVVDDEGRLRNTIAHEFCHLANIMISKITDDAHGEEFQKWGKEVTRVFEDRGIMVTTKHNYIISYKYVWKCENCGKEFKRHSMSIDPERHRCGNCKSRLTQIKPVPYPPPPTRW